MLILFRTHRRNICFDSASSQANCDHSSDKTTKASIVKEGCRRRSRNQDDETNDIDDACAADSFEFAEILV